MISQGVRVARASVLGLALVMLGCGSDEAPAAIAPEPPAAVTPAAPSAESPTPEAPVGAPSDAPGNVELAVFAVRSGWDPMEPTDEGLAHDEHVIEEPSIHASVPVFSADPPGAVPLETLAALNAVVESRVFAAAAGPASDDEIWVGCNVTLATTTLVSMFCTVTGSGGRTGFDSDRLPLSLRIADGDVEFVVVDDAFAPDIDLDAIAARACRGDGAPDDPSSVAACDDPMVLTFGSRGVAVHSYDPTSDTDFTIGYDDPELAGHLLVDGPLGTLLPIGTRTTASFDGDVVLAATLAAHCDVRWAMGPARPLDAFMLDADRDDRVDDSLVAAGDGFRATYETCARTLDMFHAGEAAARALAPDGAIERVPSTAARLQLTRYLTTEELSLRAAPGTEGAFLRTLPPGTRLVGVMGMLGAQMSGPGQRGSWARVVAADGVSGWVAGRYLQWPAGRCGRPSAAQITAALPPEASGASITLGQHDATLIVWARGRTQSWMALSESCSLTPVTRTITVPGRLESVRFLSARDGVTPLLVTSSMTDVGEPGFDGVLRYMLVAPDATEPSWSMEAPGHPTLPSREHAVVDTEVRANGTTWDVTVRARGAGVRRVRWDGAAFVESTGR